MAIGADEETKGSGGACPQFLQNILIMHNVDNTQPPGILSLCSGMLGIERGLSRSGFSHRVLAYVEREAFAAFNLVRQMEKGMVDQAPIWTDIETFDGRPFRNRVYGIVGGYPCQGESRSGSRRLERDERFLWPHIREIVRAVNPLFCFFENVDDHLSGSFPIVLRDLHGMGFQVEAGIYSAVECGAPHHRQRLFALACSDIREMRECLAYAHRQHGNLPAKPRNEKTGACQRSSLLANAGGKRCRTGHVSAPYLAKKDESPQAGEPFGTNTAAAILPDANCFRSGEGSAVYQPGQFDQDGEKWPAGPGRSQYRWEAPRTAKPGMGCTVDGYNFRIDLLRMYGNGVVPQAAEKAWVDLIQKLIS